MRTKTTCQAEIVPMQLLLPLVTNVAKIHVHSTYKKVCTGGCFMYRTSLGLIL